VAYEPVWAIGTGRSASIEEITNIHNRLKERIDRPILYGGSVKPSNIADIASIPSVDGFWLVVHLLKLIAFRYSSSLNSYYNLYYKYILLLDKYKNCKILVNLN